MILRLISKLSDYDITQSILGLYNHGIIPAFFLGTSFVEYIIIFISSLVKNFLTQ